MPISPGPANMPTYGAQSSHGSGDTGWSTANHKPIYPLCSAPASTAPPPPRLRPASASATTAPAPPSTW